MASRTAPSCLPKSKADAARRAPQVDLRKSSGHKLQHPASPADSSRARPAIDAGRVGSPRDDAAADDLDNRTGYPLAQLDLLVRGRKFSGILTEMRAEPDRVHYAVVGIGNKIVNQTKMPAEICDIATSLRIESGKTAFALRAAHPLAPPLRPLLQSVPRRRLRADHSPLLAGLRSYVSGASASASPPTRKIYTGSTAGLEPSGVLRVARDDGRGVELVLSGDVQEASWMLLALDVGNTNTVLGVFRGKELAAHWRLTTARDQTIDEYGILTRDLFTLAKLDPSEIGGVIISSVVPQLNGTLAGMADRYFNRKALFVEPGVKTGMPVLYDNPQEVGADRIVNSVAAIEKYGAPCIVVDFGTAINFDAVSPRGEYLWRRACPRNRHFRRRTFRSRCPPLSRRDKRSGQNHRHQHRRLWMQAGLFYGYTDLVDGILDRMKKVMGCADAKVIATGGQASLDRHRSSAATSKPSTNF